jgi:O-antigen/teichoic acid export membrane protein
LTISLPRVKTLFSYGWKLLVSSLLIRVYGAFRRWSSQTLHRRFAGVLQPRAAIPEMIANNLTSVALAVLFPAYSQKQDDQPLVLEMVRKTNRPPR